MAPSKATLKKYGITEGEWQALYDKYNGACHVCLKIPKSGRLNIEHEHVKGWSKMPPEQKKLYIRGLADFICNFRILTKGVTLEKLKHAVEYLERYEQTKTSPK